MEIELIDSKTEDIEFHIDNRETTPKNTARYNARSKANEKKKIMRAKDVFFKTIRKYNNENFTYFNVHFEGEFSFSLKNGEVIESCSSIDNTEAESTVTVGLVSFKQKCTYGTII